MRTPRQTLWSSEYPLSMLYKVLAAAFIAAASAFSAPPSVAGRSVVARASTPVMDVCWASAPAEAKWAEAAWVELGLHSKDLGESCVYIPENTPGLPDNTHNWYFCSTAAMKDAKIQHLELPMLAEGRKVSLQPSPSSAGASQWMHTPNPTLTAVPRVHRCTSAGRPTTAALRTRSELAWLGSQI